MFACPDDIPALENFAYGDTPTRDALGRLIQSLLAEPAEFDISVYDLATRFDIRFLVLRTALTYLELAGTLFSFRVLLGCRHLSYNAVRLWRLSMEAGWVLMKFFRPWARAGWAKYIVRTTRDLSATWP